MCYRDRPTVKMTEELGYRGNHNAVTYSAAHIVVQQTA